MVKLAPIHYRSYWQSGFTYVGLLFTIALIGIVLGMTATLWSFAQKREKERELLFIGHQFRRAIGLYYERTPGMVKRFPNTIEDLLDDNRYVTPQHYLRRIYLDPITLSKDWGLVTAPDGGIMGVFSKSELETIKRNHPLVEDQLLSGQERYSDWKFLYQPTY